jgi:hypothetical protein
MARMNRAHTNYVRLSDYERWAIERMAQNDGVKMSEMIRELIRADAKRRGLDVEYRDVSDE